MNPIRVRRHNVAFLPESARVIIRPFIPGKPEMVARILTRVLALSESDTEAQLQEILAEFNSRHFDIEEILTLYGPGHRHRRGCSWP